MPIVSLKDVSLSYGAEEVFGRLDLNIYPDEKVGLVGPNGCGKTTLLKLVCGQLTPDLGEIRQRKNTVMGYLPQEPVFSGERTVSEELCAGATEVQRVQKELHEVSHEISTLSGEQQKAALRRYERLTHEFELAGGYEFETRAKEVTAGLGLDNSCLEAKTSDLSGGQLSRLGLAQVLLTDANLLLLDEPTNHLDWDACLWLEKFLRKFKGAAVIVSHDRYLLDRLVSKIIEVRGKKACVYKGNYSTYRAEKEKKDLALQRQYEQRKDFIERTRDFIARNKDQEGMRGTARGRKKYLNRILHYNPDYLDKPDKDRTLDFSFGDIEQDVRAKTVVSFENVSKRFDDVLLFEGLSFEVLAGQRLGIIGPNGAGKTTLLNLALGKMEPSAGAVALKKSVSVGYLDQAGAELDAAKTVLDEAGSVRPAETSQKMRGKLGAFLFTGDDVFKRVADLSGGQRSRLALCKLVLTQPELLVLDEPTNHLDIPSTEALEDAIAQYAGTIIVVSHDRFFLDRVVDSLLVLGIDELGRRKPGRFEFVAGGYTRYADLLEQRAAHREDKEERAAPKPKRPRRQKEVQRTPPELKPFNAWSIEKIEQAIEGTDEEIVAIQERFGDEEVYRKAGQLAKLRAEFEHKKAYLELLWRAYEWRNRDTK